MLMGQQWNNLYVEKFRNYFKHTLISCILPFAFFLALVAFHGFKSSTINILLLLTGYLLWAAIYSFGITQKFDKPLKEKLDDALFIIAYVFSTQLASFFSILIVFLITFSKHRQEATYSDLFLIFLFYVMINFLSSLPVFSKKKFEVINQSKKTLNPSQIIYQSHQRPIFLIMGILFLTSLLPNFSPYIVENSLKLLNIGLKKEIIITDAAPQCGSWPDFIIDKGQSNFKSCISKPGTRIIQLGSRGYFHFPNTENNLKHVSLNIQKSSFTQELPEDSLYINTLNQAIKN